MTKKITPGMLCFLVNIPKDRAGHEHLGKIVTIFPQLIPVQYRMNAFRLSMSPH